MREFEMKKHNKWSYYLSYRYRTYSSKQRYTYDRTYVQYSMATICIMTPAMTSHTTKGRTLHARYLRAHLDHDMDRGSSFSSDT